MDSALGVLRVALRSILHKVNLGLAVFVVVTDSIQVGDPLANVLLLVEHVNSDAVGGRGGGQLERRLLQSLVIGILDKQHKHVLLYQVSDLLVGVVIKFVLRSTVGEELLGELAGGCYSLRKLGAPISPP